MIWADEERGVVKSLGDKRSRTSKGKRFLREKKLDAQEMDYAKM
jgi:hypothetical protein